MANQLEHNMNKNKNKTEKRNLPRLLCDDNFSQCIVIFKESNTPAQAINFHHRGIALYTPTPLQNVESADISFIYAYDDEKITITGLPIRFVHINEMDVGCQYGASFQTKDAQHSAIIEKLKRIEHFLKIHNETNDRYGLFE